MKTAAIIGCGKPGSPQGGKVGWGIAYAHADGYRQAFAQVELSAVDPNAENLAAFASKYGIPSTRCFASAQAMYEAGVPDAVSICTWPGLHVPMAHEAINRGVKAIAVEKPLGLHGLEIQGLVQVAAKGPARVAVAHQRRYEPWFVQARQWIREGILGEKLVLEARVGDEWDMLSWTVHWFDMANFLLDCPQPDWVLAGLDHTGARRYGHAVENASTVLAQYSENRQAIFVTGPASQPYGLGIAVRGTKGMMVIGKTLRLWTTEGYREQVVEVTPGRGAFAELLSDLWKSVGSDYRSACDVVNCAPATQMAYAAQESARTMRRVSMPLTTWYGPLEVVQHPAQGKTSRSLRVALLADGHHEWAGVQMSGRDGLQEAMTELGYQVVMLDAKKELADDALDQVDLLVIYHTQIKTCPTHRRVVGRWMEQGRATVVSHCGIGGYGDWQQYKEMIGLYWVWKNDPQGLPPSGHPHVACTLTVDDPARLGLPWMQAWLPADEMYQRLGQASPVHVLVTAQAESGQSQAYAWQVVNHPHVTVWLPGHRRDMFGLSAVRDGLVGVMDLAVGSAAQAKA